MNPLFEFAENKNSRKNSVFIVHGKEEISYSEFDKLVNSCASFLKESGIKKGDHIAIIDDNNPDFILIVFSIWKLKAVPVPVNIKLLPKEIEEQIGFADCKYVLISKYLNIKIKYPNVICFPFKDNKRKKTSSKKPAYNKNETALIMFTSGSSGNSKGVILTFNNLIQSARIGNKVLNQNEKDRWLASLPFYHIGGFSIFIRAYLSGASVIIPKSLSTNEIISAVKKFKPTLASFVSTQLKRLIEKNVKPNKELKNILIGGGFTSEELSIKAVKKGWRITKVYGSTEVSSFVSAIIYTDIPDKPGSSGKALYPNKIKIVNENIEYLPADFAGEIIVNSPALMKGYYKDPEATSAKIKNKFFYTGDIGCLDNEGYLFVEARRDDLIISGGENIIPKEVESAVLKHPYIKDALVLGIKNEEWGQEVSAVISLKKNKKVNRAELKEFLKDKLPGYKIPRKIFFIDKIPKTSLGKVRKEKLLKLFKQI